MNSRFHQAGSSLMEGLIALLIFSVGALGVAAAQINQISHSTQAEFRVTSAALANELSGLAVADPANASCLVAGAACASATNKAYFADWLTRVANTLPSDAGHAPTTSLAADVFTVTLFWRRKGESDWHNTVVRTHIRPGV